MKGNTPIAFPSAVAPSRDIPLTSRLYTLDKKRRRVVAGVTPEETTEFELLDAQLPLNAARGDRAVRAGNVAVRRQADADRHPGAKEARQSHEVVRKDDAPICSTPRHKGLHSLRTADPTTSSSISTPSI